MPRPRRTRPPSSPDAPPGLPSREQVAAFIREQGETDLSAMASFFGVRGADRRALRHLIQDMTGEGETSRRGRKGLALAGAFPPVGVADVDSRDVDGELWVRLSNAGEELPAVRLAPGADDARRGAPGLGDRVLVRFEPGPMGEMEAKLIKKLGVAAPKVLGVVRKSKREVRVEPADRRGKDVYLLTGPEAEALRDGDLVLVQADARPQRSYGPKPARLLEAIGREDEPRAASILAIAAHDIPTGFPEAAEAEAEAAPAPSLGKRTDLRDLPLITIDPADARDHDDAVFAEPDGELNNLGGWIVWVAIADVAAYVRPGSALDRTAWTKGNSVYLPDRVEPMLPERLSAGLCSLVEGEDRATLAVRMVFDSDGRKREHRFVRGLMRCAAGVSYEQAQSAAEGRTDEATGPLLEPVIKPLWAAYRVLKAGRDARSPLAIESAERSIRLSAEGEVASITPRPSLEAHRLIEEFMIQANVAAAEELERRRTPLVYRIHDAPSQEKLFSLADFLDSLAIPWTKGAPVTTKRLNELLASTRSVSPFPLEGGRVGDGGVGSRPGARTRETPPEGRTRPPARTPSPGLSPLEGERRAGRTDVSEIVNEVVLRSQSQAVYSPENIGHFGLNLTKYAHFTSPIRRYADLVVHRALIRALKLGDDGLPDSDAVRLPETAEHITATERRAMAAERDATDRYVAAFLADRVGAEFAGRITGVTRFGLFVRLTDTGADGLVPVSTLGDEYFVHDERLHALVGERSGERWPLGKRVDVRLREATPLTGGLLFEMLSEAEPADPTLPRPRLGVRGRPGSGPPRRLPGKGGPPAGVRKGKRR